MVDPKSNLPRPGDDIRRGATVTTPIANFGAPNDTVPGDTSLRRRGVLPGESSLPFGTLPGGTTTSTFDMTDDQGAYLFPSVLPPASNYTLTPTKDDNPLNGVSTYDLVLITRHILGLEPLWRPVSRRRALRQRLGNDGVEAVARRTEGWPAAVRMAQIILSNAADPVAALTDFSGSDEALAHLLNGQVLSGFPEAVREFLLCIARRVY